MTEFSLKILAAEKTVYVGACESLTVPASDGSYGILAHHRNTMMALAPGELRFRTPEGKSCLYVVSAGMVEIENNHVLVLVETAEFPEEIDRVRAEQAAIRAKEDILLKQSIQERRTAQLKLARAISRMRAKDNVNNK